MFNLPCYLLNNTVLSNNYQNKDIVNWQIKVIRADNGLPIPNATVEVFRQRFTGSKRFFTDGNGVAREQWEHSNINFYNQVSVLTVSASGYISQDYQVRSQHPNMTKHFDSNNRVLTWTIALQPEQISTTSGRHSGYSDIDMDLPNNYVGWKIRVIRADNGLPIPNATVEVFRQRFTGSKRFYTDGNGIAQEQWEHSNVNFYNQVSVLIVTATGYYREDYQNRSQHPNMTKHFDSNNRVLTWTIALQAY